MTAETERWLPVVGYEGLYEVSDQGRVKSLPRQTPAGARGGKLLKPYKESRGYTQVRLWRNGQGKSFRVHPLVAEAFIGPCPLGLQCCHNNGKPDDNRLSNLRWDSQAGNEADKRLHGTLACGERHGAAKLSERQVCAIRADPRTQRAIAADYNISFALVSLIKRRHLWAHAP